MSFSENTPQTDLAKKTVKGIFWSYLSFIGGKGLTFLSTIILARLLLPEEFGLMGYCLIAIQYLDILNTVGIGIALIACHDKVEETANAAFIASIILGGVTFGLTWFISPYLAQFFHEPQITSILRVLAFILPIGGLGVVPDAMIQRGLRFNLRVIPDVGRNFVKGITSIVLALTGFGVWSLIFGQIAASLISTVLVWALSGWRPTWRFSAQANRSMVVFGLNIFIMDIFAAFGNNVDYILVGRILGASALGYYTMAYRIPELVINSLSSVVGNVSFPALASTQSNKEEMRLFYFGYIRYFSLFIFPIGMGLTLTAPLIIPLFLSNTWSSAVVPTSLIAAALTIMAIGYVPGVLYKSINRPDILNYLSLAKLPVAFFILWYSTRWGINGVAMGQVAIGLILLSIDMLWANYIMKYQILDLIKAMFPSSVSSIAMALSLLLFYWLFSPSGILGLLFLVVSGAAIYIFTLMLVSRETVMGGLEILQKSVGRMKPGLAQLEEHQ